MASIEINSSSLGNTLQALLMSEEIIPGSEPSYELCKQLYLYHPLAKKMAEKPIDIAMSQERDISIPNSPEQMIKEAFLREWEALGCDKHIFNVMRLSRIYGIASVIYGAVGVPTDKPIDPKMLANIELYFNILDPLNTAGSLVLNQNPNAPDFQKHSGISVSGQAYHRSRSCTIMNEEPIYISFTTSAYGFVGRSVYQRALYPMKSFIQSMITDEMVTRKAGIIIAKTRQAGSIVDAIMVKTMALKRELIKQAATWNIISVDRDDSIEAINLTNTDTAMTTARKNILENIASAASMPAKMLNNETFAEGFGEGTEDAKSTAEYVNGIRQDMRPLYEFFDKIVRYRAWNPEFYKTVQAEFPEMRKVPYTKAFFDWSNSFVAKWPSLLIEPESELVKVEDVKLKAIIAMIEVMLPNLDPDNKAAMIEWAANNFNEQKMLFKQPLLLDYEALASYTPPAPPEEEKAPKPFGAEA
jgi:hypothetical protein